MERDFPALDQTLPSTDRLRALLFVVDKKLEQRGRLQAWVSMMLGVALLLSLAMVVAGIVYLRRGAMVPAASDDATSHGWAWGVGVAFVLAPFFLTFLHYLWITFAQIYYRSLNVVDELLDTSDYQEFKPLLHRDMLEDDGSLLAQLRSLYTVDVGLTSALFRVAGSACALAPLAIQAFASVVTVVLLWRTRAEPGASQSFVMAAVGLAVLYALFLALGAVKTWSLYRFVRRMK